MKDKRYFEAGKKVSLASNHSYVPLLVKFKKKFLLLQKMYMFTIQENVK